MAQNLSLNPNSVSRMLAKDDWLCLFAAEYERVANTLVSCELPEGDLFNRRVIVSGRDSYSEHREKIRRWMVLAWQKSRSLFTVLLQLPMALEVETKAQSQYGDINLGPIDSDATATLSLSQMDRIRDANVIRGYTRDAILNCCGYFVSELFFSFEAACRVVCMGSCLQFFHKTVLPDITVQHKDVYDTLCCLSSESRERVVCRICRANEVCHSAEVFRYLREFYLLLYHLRVIRDYKTEFYSTDGLASALLTTFIPSGLEVSFKTEALMSESIGNRMRFPLSLSEQREHIERIMTELNDIQAKA